MPEEQQDNSKVNAWLREQAHLGQAPAPEENPFADTPTEQLRADYLRLDGRTKIAKAINEELSRRHLGGLTGGGEGGVAGPPVDEDMNRLIRRAAGRTEGDGPLDNVRLSP